MNLPKLSLSWPTGALIKVLIECFRQVEAADGQNRKQGADIEVGQARLILTDTLTHDRVALSVAGGVVTLTPL